MAGRNYLPPDALKLRDMASSRSHHSAPIIDDHRPLHGSSVPVPGSRPPFGHALIEDRLAAQHHEIQTLLSDNQRLAAAHVGLKRDLAAAQQELRHLSSTAAAIKAERDSQVREVYERSLKMEAEVRLIEAQNAELAQVKADIKNLASERKEFTSKLQEFGDDIARARSELRDFPAIEAEIKAMHHEIQRGRAAVEYEKKMHATNLEQTKVMEKSMLAKSSEIEKLRAELANSEKRARAAAAAAAAAAATPSYGNSEMNYGGNPYPNPYAAYQVQNGAIAGPPYYGHGTMPQGHYDMQWNHVQR